MVAADSHRTLNERYRSGGVMISEVNFKIKSSLVIYLDIYKQGEKEHFKLLSDLLKSIQLNVNLYFLNKA